VNEAAILPRILHYLEKTGPGDLPPDVVETTKKFILDSLGVAVAGCKAPGCVEVADLLEGWEGKPEATVICRGRKLPAPWAAMANSMTMHALDFDDTLDESALHAHVSVLPAALACAEAMGGVSGAHLITSVALGVDLVCRLGLATLRPLSWIRTATCGAFGAAVAAARMLGLDGQGLLKTMGIVYSQTAGNAQCLVDGGLVKRMQPAFSAKAGVLSAFLASKGITGARDFLEGQYGFYNLYEGGEYDRERLVTALGEHYHTMDLSIKPYPSCRMTHASIDAALSLRQEVPLDPAYVDEIMVEVSSMSHTMVGSPFAIRSNPQVDAQFSIPYTVATAILHGDVSLEHFDEACTRDARISDFSRKVQVVIDPKLPDRDMGHAFMQIRYRGAVCEKRVEAMKGSPANPMSMNDCVAKFRKCVAYSKNGIIANNAGQIVELTSGLESVDDIRVLTNLLAGQGAFPSS
jgi:2-methylcitrate dehydratase PrpD